ncbi:MAG: phage tail tape measure protein, partial [Pseudomonadota bacterium]|nr:phage tail tape measure protein [Pseudomonadota bacterium]
MSTTVEYDILVEVLDAVKDLKKLQTQTKKTKGGLDDTKKSGVAMAGDIGSAFTGLKNAASTVANAITKITSAFVDAAKASFELTREVVDSINDLNDLSTVSGISAQNIEALRTAFVASGQSADSANTILKMFPRIMNQLSNETSDASKVFRGLGLSMRDASGNAKSA